MTQGARAYNAATGKQLDPAHAVRRDLETVQ